MGRCNSKSQFDVVTKEKYDLLQQENKQLKDNWNELKEYLIKYINENHSVRVIRWVNTDNILKIMGKLEKGDSNE